ncbi:hypothetical protein BELL_0851g00010 [Botrytis elliptica]|uniref:Uncharacterized protein n=1 Tax=Botrytis elliptica TaxID=278938 RepID=A0A4Z1J9C0_9HELO|nr:hypothetical protein BELL_0851g00010 [Botrytis elliptica]
MPRLHPPYTRPHANILFFLRLILLIQWLTFVYFVVFCSFKPTALTSPFSFSSLSNHTLSSSPPSATPNHKSPPSYDLPTQLSEFHAHIHTLQSIHYRVLDKLETLSEITNQRLRDTLLEMQFQLLSHKSRLQKAEWTRLWKEWYRNGKGKGKFGLEQADIQVDERGDWGKGELENLGLWKGEGEGECMVWVNTTNVKRMMDALQDLTQEVGESKLRIRGLDNLWTEFVESFLESIEQVLSSEGRWGWRRLHWRRWTSVQGVRRRWWRRCWNLKRLMQWGLIFGHLGGLIWLTGVLKVGLGLSWLTRMLGVRLGLRLWRSGRQEQEQEGNENGKANRGPNEIQEHSHQDLPGDDSTRYSQLDLQMRELRMTDQNSQMHTTHPHQLPHYSQSDYESSSPSPPPSPPPSPTPSSTPSSTPSLTPSYRFQQAPLYPSFHSSQFQVSQTTPTWSPNPQPHLYFSMASTSSPSPSISSKAEFTTVSDISEESEESSTSVDNYVYPHDYNHIQSQNRGFVYYPRPYQPSGTLPYSSSSPIFHPTEIRAPSESHTTTQIPDQDLQICESQHVTSNQNAHVLIRILKTTHHPIFFYAIFLLITYLTIILLYPPISYLHSYPSSSSSTKQYQSSIKTSLALKQPPNFFFSGESGKESKRDNNIPPPRAILIPSFQEGISFPLFYYEQWWKNSIRILKELEDFVQFTEELKTEIGTGGCGKLDMNSDMKHEKKKGKKTKSQSGILTFFNYFSRSIDTLETQFEEEDRLEIDRELRLLRKKVESISDLILSDTFLETVEELLESVKVGGKLGRSWVKGAWDAGRWSGLRAGDGKVELMELEQGLRSLSRRLREKKKESSMKLLWEEECWVRGEREMKRMMEEGGKEGEELEDYMGDKCIVGKEEWEDMKGGVFKEWGGESVGL